MCGGDRRRHAVLSRRGPSQILNPFNLIAKAKIIIAIGLKPIAHAISLLGEGHALQNGRVLSNRKSAD